MKFLSGFEIILLAGDNWFRLKLVKTKQNLNWFIVPANPQVAHRHNEPEVQWYLSELRSFYLKFSLKNMFPFRQELWQKLYANISFQVLTYEVSSFQNVKELLTLKHNINFYRNADSQLLEGKKHLWKEVKKIGRLLLTRHIFPIFGEPEFRVDGSC